MNINRRQLLQTFGGSVLGVSASGLMPALAANLAGSERRRRCVVLWMTGGPSQIDTFDLKPGHENGGEFKEIETSVPGLRISEHLPRLAKQADQLAIIRSLNTKEGDHGRGTFLMRTGHAPTGPIRYPAIGSSLAKTLGGDDDVPAYVSIAPYRVFNREAFSPGFLGPKYAPLTVGAADTYQQTAANGGDDGFAELAVDDLAPPSGVESSALDERLELWRSLEESFVARHASEAPLAHKTVYERAVRLMNSKSARAFDLVEETDKTREAYGRGRFGQGCLMARRLLEAGVSCVEVSLGTFGGGSLGWDTHRANFAAVKSLSEELDAGWASLMRDLGDRGLLEDTTILWLGEFGRTPKINRAGGRDHFPNAWTCVLAGSGIAGGQAYGRTSPDGMTVEEGQVGVGDVLATLCTALDVPPDTQNISEMGRPIRIAEGEPIKEVLG